MIVTKTPLRVSFFGGGTDLPAYCNAHVGCTLSCTIDKYVYVAVNPSFGGGVRASYSETENVTQAAVLKHDRIRECLLETGLCTDVEVVTVADVPGGGTGLGSSSSLTVGLLAAVAAFQNETPTAYNIADEACVVEMYHCQAPIGRQDQYAAALGGLRLNTYYTYSVASLQMHIPTGLQDRLLLFHTGVARSGDALLAAEQKAVETRSVCAKLTTMARQAVAGADAVRSEDWPRFGALLDEGWQLKRSLSPGISTPQIDGYYTRALQAGAYGGKICGAGGGGFLLVFAEPECHEDIKANLGELKHVPIRLTQKGSEVIYRDGGTGA